MKPLQRNLLITIAVIMIVMVLFPPTHIKGTHTGYRFLFDMTESGFSGEIVNRQLERILVRYSVDVGLLLLQEVVVIAVGFIAYFISGRSADKG